MRQRLDRRGVRINMAKEKHNMELRPNPRTGRYRLISANWKMNLNHLEAIQAIQKLNFLLRPADYSYTEISIHPPFTDLRPLQLLIDSDRMRLSLGAQNCHFEASGAYTGEISAPMLAKLNVTHVIVGHSERRQYFCETDEIVRAKVEAVFRSQMTPIICVGESRDEREQGLTEDKLRSQVDAVVSFLAPELAERCVIAYEPIWAIGSGASAKPEDAQKGAATIRSVFESLWGKDVAGKVRIQYGGSVHPTNAADFMQLDDIDGLLVGSAALDPESFARIIQA